MANCAIFWPNEAEYASFSGGSWLTSLPLTNLIDPALAKVARSVDTLEAHTQFILTFAEPKAISMISLINHNLESDAKIRTTLYSDALCTNSIYTELAQDVWPSIFQSEDLEWEDDNWWMGTLSETQLESFPKVWLKLWDTIYYTMGIKVEVLNVSNSFGHIDLGGIFLASRWSPKQNITYGSTLGWVDESEIMTTWNGTEHAREKKKYREVVGTLDFMDDDEGVNQALLMTGDRGVTKDVFFVWDPADPLLLMQRSFLGRLRVLNPLEARNWRTNGMTIQIKERT